MGCAFDKQCYQGIWNTLSNTKCMPGINRAVWKYNIGSILRDIFTTVIDIGGGNSCGNRVNWYIEDQWTQFRIVVQRDKVSKRLVGGVGCLKVAKLSTRLVSPLPFCKERKNGASAYIWNGIKYTMRFLYLLLYVTMQGRKLHNRAVGLQTSNSPQVIPLYCGGCYKEFVIWYNVFTSQAIQSC